MGVEMAGLIGKENQKKANIEVRQKRGMDSYL